MSSGKNIFEKENLTAEDIFNNRAAERHFNEVIFEEESVIKKVFDVKKGLDEVFFYRHIPGPLQKYFPNLLHAVIEQDKVVYKISLIKLLDLSIWYTQKRLSPTFLKSLLSKLDIYFDLSPKKNVSAVQWQESFKTAVIAKLDRRWLQYQQKPLFLEVARKLKVEHELSINDLKNKIETNLINKASQTNDNQIIFSHGDLCFSNILTDKFDQIYFVDPRGAQSEELLFLPKYYDLAKLSQCVFGNYDGILNEKRIDFTSQKKVFTEWLKQKNIDINLLRLVEASFFLSLLPLHADDVDLHVQFILSANQAFKASEA